MRMNVKESTMVRPMGETLSGGLWLSNLDLQMPATYHSRFVFLYRSNGAANFFDVGLLKAALGRAMVDFYPYAGRLEKADDGRLQINCNAEGVLFVEAECDAAVDDLGGFAARAPDLSLVLKVDYSRGISTWPLLLLQPLPPPITPLPNTGTSQATFKLTPALLRALKQRCKSGYTTYEVVTGHVWRCVCAARGLPPDQETRLQTSVDGRLRLQPPLPPGFFGNVIFYTTSTALCGELVSNPVEFAAEKVHALVARMNDEYLRSAVDYLEVQLPNIPQTARSDNTMRCPNFDITSWARLPSFEADFGWGKPVYAGPAAAPYEGKGYLFIGAESDGSWLLEITLLKPHMEAFQKLFYDISSVHEKYDNFMSPRL